MPGESVTLYEFCACGAMGVRLELRQAAQARRGHFQHMAHQFRFAFQLGQECRARQHDELTVLPRHRRRLDSAGAFPLRRP